MVTVKAKSELTKTLSEMKRVYTKNPENAVRSKKFIQKLQEYCASELKKRVDASNVKTKTEVKLQTPYSAKRVDVVSIMVDNGPMIAISVKSQMSSTMKISFITMRALLVMSLHCIGDFRLRQLECFGCFH